MRNRKGVVLLLMLIIITGIAIVVGAFLYMLTAQERDAGSNMARTKAYWLAEAGVQQALYKIRNDSPAGYRASPTNISVTTLEDGTYAATVVKAGNGYTITSTGVVGGETRIIKSMWRDSLFNHAVFSGGSSGGMTIAVDLGGQALTDSYDATQGAYNALLADGSHNIGNNGDVGTNADIRTSGQAYIGGNAITGPLGTFGNASAVAGTITRTSAVSLPPVVVPSLAWLSLPEIQNNKDNVIASGNYSASDIGLSGQTTVTLTGPSNIYLTGSNSIDMGAQNSIIIAGTGPVLIYVDGNVTISGQGIVNNSSLPANCQIYGTTSCTSIDYKGQASFYGAIYAPKADVTLSGQGGMYGAFISDTTTIGGQGGVHYDESLINLASETSLASLKAQDYHDM